MGVSPGRVMFDEGSWRDALDVLSSAAARSELPGEDLVRLAMAAYLTRVEGWDTGAARAYEQCVDRDEPSRAACCAFWLAFGLFDEGEASRGSGWLARAQQLLDDEDAECAERGLLMLPTALAHLESGDPGRAYEVCTEVWQLGLRFENPDVVTLGCLGRGQALIEQGDRAAGQAMLDEAMIAVASGDLSAPAAGLVACGAIATCQRLFDLARAREWTAALTRWCDASADLASYRGQCMIHRAEVLRVHGSWDDAAEAADAACEALRAAPAVGDALYERAELHRLRGELEAAEDAYRAASRAGRDPQPGMALLRLAQGDVAAASSAMLRASSEASGPVDRARLLGPLAEVMFAAKDLAAARRAIDELTALATTLDAAYLRAVVRSLTGRAELAEGDPRAAIVTLRRAWREWQEIGSPHEAARARVLVAEACRRLGDSDGAAMELDAARWIFHELGAAVDLTIVEVGTPGLAPTGGLTAREIEVLRLVASGLTNRAAAAELFISEKTVARHVANIFTKLGVSNRAAATAWAYEHGVMASST